MGKVLAQIVYPSYITNPTGASALYAAGTSDIDSVTIGATMPYYVLPDLNFNPKLQLIATPTQYDQTKIFTKANIESLFSWAIPSGCTAAHVPSTASYPDLVNLDNFMNITFTTSVLQTITVNETSASTYGGCSGTTNFKVQVINAPTAQFSSAGLYQCLNTSSLTLPISITSAQKYIASESAFIALTITAVNKADNKAVTLNAIANIYPDASGVMVNISSVAPYTSGLPEGIYTFTLSNVTDRISRKCGISGTIGSQNTITVYVKPPKPTLKTSAVQ